MWYVDGDGWTGTWLGAVQLCTGWAALGQAAQLGRIILSPPPRPAHSTPQGGGASAGGWSVERVYQLGKIPSLHCVNLTIDSQRILRHNLTMQCRALSSASLGGT